MRQRLEKDHFVAIIDEMDSGASVDIYSTNDMSPMISYELPEYREFEDYDDFLDYSKDNAIFDSDSSQIYFEHKIFGYFDEYDEEYEDDFYEYDEEYEDDFDEYDEF